MAGLLDLAEIVLKTVGEVIVFAFVLTASYRRVRVTVRLVFELLQSEKQ